jgi:hypothetical protein
MVGPPVETGLINALLAIHVSAPFQSEDSRPWETGVGIGSEIGRRIAVGKVQLPTALKVTFQHSRLECFGVLSLFTRLCDMQVSLRKAIYLEPFRQAGLERRHTGSDVNDLVSSVDAENSYLAGDVLEAGPMDQLLGSSITYRIAVGPQQGRKVFTLQTLPGCEEPFDAGVGKVAGFSLHAGVAARADQRQELERLCRYISRPAISEKRLSLTPNGNVRYQLKTPYRDGTTHVIFEPLDFIARLAALVPKPRVNLTRLCRSPHRQVYAHIGTMRRKRIGHEKSDDD